MPYDKQNLEQFLTTSAIVPFQATIEPLPNDKSKVKVTPWTPRGGCHCGNSLEVPKAAIASVRPTESVHWCCGKGLRVAEVDFGPEHTDLIHGAFARLMENDEERLASGASTGAHQSPWCGANCSGACGICEATGKPGPCGVCYQCRIHGCPTATRSDAY